MNIIDDQDGLRRVFALQSQAYARDRSCPIALRRDRLDRLLRAVSENETRLIEAVGRDFGARSPVESLFAEIVTTLSATRLAKRRVARWMRQRRVETPLHMRPGRSKILPQPLGVVGVIAPWNYPIYLALSPMASALAAGNRVMLKPSELTPRTTETLAEILADVFGEDEVAVVRGGAEIGAAFAATPFDHILFTGSTAVGRKIALAAADNLTPVTLELGGKSPAIIDPSADLKKATRSIVFGKLFNAGQTCVAPDYVLADGARLTETIAGLTVAAKSMFPDIETTDDYSSLISAQHFERVTDLVTDARNAGVEVIQFGDPERLAARRKMPFTIIVDPPRDLRVMREEIFGPILPVIGVANRQAAIDYVNAGERPLALYWFGEDKNARDAVLGATVSGGVTINDTNWHVVQDHLPFGGVGKSGQGVYHGQPGFDTLSQLKPVFFQSRFANTAIFLPPYNDQTLKLLNFAKRFL